MVSNHRTVPKSKLMDHVIYSVRTKSQSKVPIIFKRFPLLQKGLKLRQFGKPKFIQKTLSVLPEILLLLFLLSSLLIRATNLYRLVKIRLVMADILFSLMLMSLLLLIQ